MLSLSNKQKIASALKRVESRLAHARIRSRIRELHAQPNMVAGRAAMY